MAMPVNPPKTRRTITGLRLAVGRGSLLLSASKHARRASVRFEQLLGKVIRWKLPELPAPECLVVVCAIAFDAIPFKGQLLLYLQALGNLNTWGGRQYATWVDSGQTNRRAPSVFTLLASRGLDLKSVDWPGILEQVERALAGFYEFPGPTPIGRRIQAVLDDGMAFLEHRLPRPLIAHLLGIMPQTALPSSVWDRRNGRAPAGTNPSTVSEEDSEAATDLGAISAAVVENLYEGRAPLSGAWFVQLLHDVCDGLIQPGLTLSSPRIRKLIERLHKLSLELNEVGPVEALLLGWALDIIALGSARKSHPVIKTFSNYLKPAVKLLYTALSRQGKHPLDLTTAQWSKLFKDILEEKKDSDLRPALSSFQRYLVRAHDVEPLRWLIRGPSAVRAPRANLLWEHEFDALNPCLTHYLNDERAIEQTRAWIAILRATGMRFSAVIYLRLSGIECKEGQPIRIAFSEALKTDAARAVHEISNPALASAIRPWIERRCAEASSRNELLFGDPYRPDKIYRLAACYGALARTIKRVTGDNEIVVHAIRHTFASTEVERALRLAMTEFNEIRRLDEIRVRMGHADFRTTFGTYCHLIEDLLRDGVDLIVQRVKLEGQAAANWMLDPATNAEIRDEALSKLATYVRQKKHRDPRWSAWAAMCNLVRPAPPVQEPDSVTTDDVAASRKPLSFEGVRNIASDWCAGMDTSRIELRSGYVNDAVKEVIRELESACALARAARRARGPIPGDWTEWFTRETNLSRLAAPHWARAIRSIGAKLTKPQPPAMGGWLQACAGIGVDAGHGLFTEVLRSLKEAGFGVQSFVIRVSDPALVQDVSTAFSDVFADCAQIELVACRGGNPDAYVQVLTRPATGDRPAPPATSDMKTLRGLVLIGAAYQKVLLKQEKAK